MGSLRDIKGHSNPFHSGRKTSEHHKNVSMYLCLGYPGWRGREDLHCDECPHYFECEREEKRLIKMNPHLQRLADWHRDREGNSCFGKYLKGMEDCELNLRCNICPDKVECLNLAKKKYRINLKDL